MAVVVRMLLSRILALIPLLLGVILFVFIVMRFAPVDPALAAFDGANATAEQLQQFRLENGLLTRCRCSTSTSSGTWCRATSARA